MVHDVERLAGVTIGVVDWSGVCDPFEPTAEGCVVDARAERRLQMHSSSYVVTSVMVVV